MIDSELEATAYHEAGHAVAAYLLSCPIMHVSIVPNEEEGTEGHCASGYGRHPPDFVPEQMDDDDVATRRVLERRIMICFAGNAAERAFRGESDAVYPGSGSDFWRASELAGFVASEGSDECLAFQQWLHLQIDRRLTRPHIWAAVTAVATALLERKELSGQRVRQIIQTSFLPPGQTLASIRAANRRAQEAYRQQRQAYLAAGAPYGNGAKGLQKWKFEQ